MLDIIIGGLIGVIIANAIKAQLKKNKLKTKKTKWWLDDENYKKHCK